MDPEPDPGGKNRMKVKKYNLEKLTWKWKICFKVLQ